MIDRETSVQTLAEARAACDAAEEAWCDIEELLWEMRRSPRVWRRLAQTADDAPVALAA
jgi:hypothetical protein